MFNFSARSAIICAILPLGLLASGCTSGIGEAGLHNVVAGNWPAANKDFTEDYANHPSHPIAEFNMGASYHHDGDISKADGMFSEAVQSGKDYHPDLTLEAKGDTTSEHACTRLHRDNRLDANCGDEIAVLVQRPAPAPIAEIIPEPAPQVEAQATAIPAKQDRN